MPKTDRKPINSHSNNANAQARIAAFSREIATAGKPKVLTAQGSIASKAVDPDQPRPAADRPAIHRLAYMTAATQAELDRALGKGSAAPTPPAARPPPPARPGPPKQRPAAAAAAATPPAPAATPATTRTVSAVSFENLATALGIGKSELGRLMSLGIVEQEHYRTADDAIYWAAERVPQIVEAVLKHRASKAAATAATVKPVPSAAPAPARPNVKKPAAFGEMLTDLPNLCRRLAVSPEDVRRFVGMGLFPPGRPAAPGDPSLFYWPAASTAAIARSVKRHLAASK
jgi:hypothetical protein